MKINQIKYDKKRKSIIIIEGPQGVGKTGFAEFCRENIPFSNLYRLYGTSDKTVSGKAKAEDMYNNLLTYMKTLEHADINLLFDRTFLTEEIYCRLEYKEYSFTDVYSKLIQKLNDIDMNIYIVFLSLDDVNKFSERLKRDKTKSFTNFTIDSSVEQQKAYLQLANELQVYDNINPIIVATDDFEEAYQKLYELLPPLKEKVTKNI